MKTLVLFTASFPYGLNETFLETEILYLCKAFENVIIVTTTTSTQIKRAIPNNCEVKHLHIDYTLKTKIKSVRHLFEKPVVEEINTIRNVYHQKITSGIFRTLLVSYTRGKKIADFILDKQIFDFNHTLFYSYWCDDVALGIALAHHQNKQVKGVSRMHRWDIYFEESQINYLPFRHFITQNLQKIISISQNGIDYAIQNWKVKPETFILSRLGINNQFGQLIPNNNTVLKIVSCSNVIKVKRVHLITETLQQITNQPIEWTHFGDGNLMNELKAKIQNLPNNIKVDLKGRIPNKKIFEVYQTIKPHFLINISSSEGVPVSIMEAMSFGIPCIATNVGGNSEIVNHKNGFLLSANPSIEEIKSAIFEVYEQYQQKSNEAYNTWKVQYYAETNYLHFCKLLHNEIIV